jgi:hypothetical protein
MSDSPNILKRGMQGVRDGLNRTGQATKKAIQRAKGGLKQLTGAGFSPVDQYTEEDDEQRRKKKAAKFFGDDEPSFVSVRKNDPRRDLSTIAPEFRAQVSAGLAAANSHTTGSTLVEAPQPATDSTGQAAGGQGGRRDDDDRW